MLLRFARARGLRDNDADDVTQHCLTVISERIAEFSYDPQKGRFKGWLRTLVNNRIRDLLRGRKELQAETRDFQGAAPDAASPEELFEKIWLEEHLGHCLRELRAEVAEATFKAFWMLVMDERPVDEICTELNMKPNNVYTIKWRMTERVATKMKELLDGVE